VTWLKTSTGKAGRLAPGPVAIVLLISGCGLLGRSPKAEVPLPPPAEPAEVEAPPASLAGLTPLPSANELLTSVPIGREDPLAPQIPVPRSSGSASSSPPPGPASRQATSSPTPQGAPAATRRPRAPARLELPDDFRFSGVLRAGSTPQAFIQVGDQSGPVCPGPDGSCPASGLPSVLPKGWGVTKIDVERGRLTLRKGSRTVTTQLF
jgi:hypothetical protein